MTYHHVIRVQGLDGSVNYHRHKSDYVDPDAWEQYHYRRYQQAGANPPHSVVCVNVFQEKDE